MLKTIVQSSRPPFLLLTPACLLPAIMLASINVESVSVINIALILIGGVCAHISVNCFNEYFDYRSGLDFKTQKTPFSGGSGALVEAPKNAKAVLITALLTMIVTIAIGLFFAVQIGYTIIPIGLAGVVIIYAYTQYINKNPWFCLLSPGLSFGPLMMVGSYWVLTTHISLEILLLSLMPFCLVNNILLINQVPDVDADKAVGRRTFPIVYQVHGASMAYLAFVLMALLSLVVVSMYMKLDLWALLMLVPLGISFVAYNGLKRNGHNNDKLIPFMAMTVISGLSLPLTMSAALYLGNLS